MILPTGPHEGRRFRIDRNPFAGLWFDAIDSGKWRRIVGTGPQQSGKTLKGFVLPILYHLFELKETVIVGLPMMDMAADKWNEDILPAILQTKYKDLLPNTGAGSKGGKIVRINFKNGATLRFMSGGGNDKKRAGFTSRVVVITETDGMDESGGTSREADKITQIEGRTRAFGERARIYMECTVSTEQGRTWREYNGGTASKIVIRCPHCSSYVTPEREHLVGWQAAEDVLTAGDMTRVACPGCGVPWTEAERKAANADCKLVHKGQRLEGGEIIGEPVRTNTLGFRWNAINNLLVHQSVVGEGEWKAAREADEENADKGQRQFVWAIPSKATSVDLTEFDAAAITRRTTPDIRGRVPSWCKRITIGIDVGKWLCHWTAMAWGEHATPHVIEYGRLEVPSREMAEELAIQLTLRKFRDEIFSTGWPADGGPMKPNLVFVDVGYKQDTIREFIRESGQGWWGCKGFSRLTDESNNRQGSKLVGKGQDSVVVDLLDGLPPIVEAQANAWKSWLHARLQTPMGQPGAMTLYNPGPKSVEHMGFSKHLTAERKVEEFIAGKGLVTKWEAVNRNNHWLDASCMSCVAGWFAGERLIGEIKVEKPASSDAAPVASFGGSKRW